MKHDISDFLPYLLNQAAELASKDFQPHYKDRYGMLRTEWRVLFHLGHYGGMTAKEICERAALHKTKVSRAVAALEGKRFVTRKNVETDRRFELLSLTPRGRHAFTDLSGAAKRYDTALEGLLGADDFAALKRLAHKLIDAKSGGP